MTAPLDKALPDVPVGPYTIQREQFVHPSEDDEELVLESVTILHTERTNDQNLVTYPSSNTLNEISDRPPLFPSPLPSIIAVEESMSALPQEEVPIEWRHELEAEIPSSVTTLKTDIDEDCVPPPLSPRPPASPQPQEPELQDLPSSVQSRSTTSGHQRLATMESTSWLDTIDESAGSSSSSAHSRTSSIGLRGKHMRNISGNTEAEFDAALDAAVEAAYDDGYELMDGEEETPEPTIVHDSAYSNEVRKNVDLAKQRVRDMERETAILAARENERKRIEDGKEIQQTFDDAEGEEEERMLEDMTRNYILEHRDINTAPKAIPPRQSDSSEFSGRTLGSSVGSTLTAGTSLSTVSELTSLPILSTQAQTKAPVAPPPTGALPAPPITKTQGILPSSRFVPDISPRTSTAVSSAPGVRERRLSGQKASVLTINTAVRLPTSLAAPKTHAAFELPPLAPPNQLPDAPRSATLAMELIEDPENMISPPTESLPDSSKQISGPSPASTSRLIDHEEHTFASTSPARTRPTLMGLRKNFSASSLRSLTRHGAVTPVSEDIPGTPMTRIFSSGSVSQRPEIMPDLPTPGVASFAKAGANAVGLSILDNDIHSPRTPGLPNANAMNPPIPLEPCPESFLLRPFWLMRALYQTIAHPRGGYISTRLFVPRDTWRVVNVKLKNVDEKVANCDMLTAALMNLSKVDTLDADAVLEELQSFELILDQVQAQLNKKLGADVGVQGSAALFRSPPIGADDNSNTDNNTRASGIGSKPYLSWKRLRSKNSVGPGLPLATGATSKSDSKDFLTMRSLPMTSVSNPRFAKRDPTKVLGIGPHSHYMASLGRLCDAVQVLGEFCACFHFSNFSSNTLCRPNRSSSRRPWPTLILTDTRRIGTLYSACSRIFRFLHL